MFPDTILRHDDWTLLDSTGDRIAHLFNTAEDDLIGSWRWSVWLDHKMQLACGLLLALGLFSRLAAIPLIIVMIVAILSTKIPILLGHDWWIFSLRKLERYGFFSMTHEGRLDYAMLLGAIFMLLTGSGRWSLDERISEAMSQQDKSDHLNEHRK